MRPGLLRLSSDLLSLWVMGSAAPSPATANVEWIDGFVHVSVGDQTWSVPEERLDTVICLLEAGRSLHNHSRPSAPVATEALQDETQPVRTSPPGKRRSRKRVGDALIVWMEEHTGWHHEDALLQVVIDHEMTDASPLRALKIALGKQRDSIFTDGGHGYWKLASDDTAGSLPRPATSPTVRQRILAKAKPAQEEGDADTLNAVQESSGGASAGQGMDKSERWNDVSHDAVARARRNLLGLGSTT